MTALQGLALLLLLQTAGELLVRILALPLPGPVLGLALLLPLLGWAPVSQRVGAVAALLLQHLSLLFVPVGVGVVVHLGALAPVGWRLLAVIVLSTWVGMAVTALVLRALLRAPLPPGGASADAAPSAAAQPAAGEVGRG